MFGRKNNQQLQMILESAKQDRILFAEQAAKDRQFFIEQINSMKNTENCDSDIPAIDEDPQQRKKAAYALNLCTVSVSQIVDYNDLVIMEQEYDNILNNLNLENFPKDEALLKILKQILDVVAFFRIQDTEKKMLEEKYKKNIKNAIWSAVPSPSVILAGGSAGWVGLAVSAISAVGTGYMNYRKERSKIDEAHNDKKWELQKAAMEQFDALRRELFDTAWRLADAYGFDDSYRLTARQISQYNNILTDDVPDRRLERLMSLQTKFEAYPPFWYYAGHAAAEVYNNFESCSAEEREYYAGFKSTAIDAFLKYLNLTSEDRKQSLLREDHLRSLCALELFALISRDKNIDKSYVKQFKEMLKCDADCSDKNIKEKLLEVAINNSGNAFDTIQLCASSYLELNNLDKAIEYLKILINEDYNAEMNAQLLSMVYVLERSGKYKNDHKMLCKRGYESYMIQWFNFTDNETERSRNVNAFFEKQNRFIFDKYVECVGEYINKSKSIFNNIVINSVDPFEGLIGFLDGICEDFNVLFDDKGFAISIRDKISESIVAKSDAIKNKDTDKLVFDELCKDAYEIIGNRIKKQVRDIRNATNEEFKLKNIGMYMNNVLLFKAQTKILGGNRIDQIDKKDNKKGYAKLLEISQKGKVDKEYSELVNKYRDDNRLIPPVKKQKAKFITENVLESGCLKHSGFVKVSVPSNEIVAYLDHGTIIGPEDRDILFTTKGLYLLGKFIKCYEEYNSGNIKLIDNEKLEIGDHSFKCNQVDMMVLKEMIDKLSQKAPQKEENNSKTFKSCVKYPCF